MQKCFSSSIWMWYGNITSNFYMWTCVGVCIGQWTKRKSVYPFDGGSGDVLTYHSTIIRIDIEKHIFSINVCNVFFCNRNV